MRILVNGAWRDTQAAELERALTELGYGASVVSTALNGEFIAVAQRALTQLADGDRLEVLSPMQGG